MVGKVYLEIFTDLCFFRPSKSEKWLFELSSVWLCMSGLMPRLYLNCLCMPGLMPSNMNCWVDFVRFREFHHELITGEYEHSSTKNSGSSDGTRTIKWQFS